VLHAVAVHYMLSQSITWLTGTLVYLSAGIILQDNIPACGYQCAVLTALGRSGLQPDVFAQMKLSNADGGLGVDGEL
jgi:hypothetical protein